MGNNEPNSDTINSTRITKKNLALPGMIMCIIYENLNIYNSQDFNINYAPMRVYAPTRTAYYKWHH